MGSSRAAEKGKMQRVIFVLLLLTFIIGIVFSGKDLTKDSDGDGLFDNVDDLDDDNDGILDIHDEDDDGDGIKDLEDSDWFGHDEILGMCSNVCAEYKNMKRSQSGIQP